MEFFVVVCFAITINVAMSFLVKPSVITNASMFINEFIEVELLGQKVYALETVISTATLISMKAMPNLLLLIMSKRASFLQSYPIPDRGAF